jgi:SAM-dependent methyltransferase
MNSSTHEPGGAALLRLLAGCWVTQAIAIAAKLGIADHLETGSKSCDALAATMHVHAPSLYRLLRALASVGIFVDEGNGRFALTPLADPLRTNSAPSLRDFAVMLGEPEHWRAWEGAPHSVRTGEAAFDRIFGQSHFQYFQDHPAAASIFDRAMTSRSSQENAAVVRAYDFSHARLVVEVGGGHGTLLAAILDQARDARGILLDVPHVVAAARRNTAQRGPMARAEFAGGDFFAGVPPGGDVYVAKKVIHDWSDEAALSLLRNCRRGIAPDGRLLVIEPVVPSGNGPSFNKLLDLLMLVWTSGGRERTRDEHDALLRAAGFRLERVTPTGSGVDILEAVPG